MVAMSFQHVDVSALEVYQPCQTHKDVSSDNFQRYGG